MIAYTLSYVNQLTDTTFLSIKMIRRKLYLSNYTIWLDLFTKNAEIR